MNLRELGDSMRQIMDSLTDGEFHGDLEEKLAELGQTFEQKHDRIREMIAEITSRAKTRNEEALRIKELADRDWNAVDRLKEWLQIGMQATGLKSLETTLFKTRRQASPLSVEWNGDSLPVGYIRTVETLDRSKALEDHKAGKTLPDGFKIERGEHLRLS